jgi:hypothetical protein
MNIVTTIVEFCRYKYTEFRVRGHARSDAFHGTGSQPSLVVEAVNGNPITDPAHLIEPTPVQDTSKEQAIVAEVGEQIARYPWAQLIPLPVLVFLWMGWRGSTKVFVLSGFPPVDAMLLGGMLECFNIFLVWLLHQAWLRPYDGTSRRTVHLTFLTMLYVALIGCIVALRLGQADPNEPFVLRLANSGLLVLSVTGPAFAIEMLGRIAYRVAPLLYRRNRATAVIRRAEEAHQRQLAQREALIAQNARWTDNASRLHRVYEIEYTKASTRFAKGQD